MLDGITTLFNGLIEAIGALFSLLISLVVFIVHAFQAFIGLFTHIPQIIEVISSSIALLPPFLIPFATAAIAYAVLQFILNMGKE